MTSTPDIYKRRLRLRRATLNDVAILEHWDIDPDVIAATTDDVVVERAFGGLNWRKELLHDSEVSYHLIAEVDGRPIGAMQVCDPLMEPTHYWGDVEPNLRAIDIWIGAQADRGKGYGAEMMRLAHARCFADASVRAIVIDPLVSNTRAIAFYHRLGYVTVEQRVFGDDDCLVLRLTRHSWQCQHALEPHARGDGAETDAHIRRGSGPSGRIGSHKRGFQKTSDLINGDLAICAAGQRLDSHFATTQEF